jgi:hypothetical protein
VETGITRELPKSSWGSQANIGLEKWLVAEAMVDRWWKRKEFRPLFEELKKSLTLPDDWWRERINLSVKRWDHYFRQQLCG